MMRRISRWIFGIIASALLIFAVLHLLSFTEYAVSFGVSFSPEYASSLGLDWKKAYSAILSDLHPLYIRIAAPWSGVEPIKGKYEFADIDWMMNEAEKYNAKVLLAIGQKVPRWPECFIPQWSDATEQSKSAFLSYIGAVIDRYKNHKALEWWQVENEPFIKFNFGECGKFNEKWVADEITLVRETDKQHLIVITDSGELGFWWKAARSGDIIGATVYRVVLTPKGQVWSYAWLPASIYRLHAFILGKDYNKFIISELQAEPWVGDKGVIATPIAEQERTMNQKRFLQNIEYARHTGASRTYLWGVEWWYWMKEVQKDGRYWEVAKNVL